MCYGIGFQKRAPNIRNAVPEKYKNPKMAHQRMVCYGMAMSWPTTDDPRDVFVTIRLTRSEADEIDTYAQARGVTRSQAVRAAIETATTSAPEQRNKRAKP